MANWKWVPESEWEIIEYNYIQALAKEGEHTKEVTQVAVEEWKANITEQAKASAVHFKELMAENWNQPTPLMWQWVKPEVPVNNLQKVVATINGKEEQGRGEKQIGEVASKYMQQVFQKQPCKRKKWKKWLQTLQRKGKWKTIPQNSHMEMMKPPTVQEVRETFARGKKTSAPGPRNFPGDTWAKMVQESEWLAKIVTKAWEEAMLTTSWPRTFEHSITKMVWKQKGMPEQIENWRPISVMDWDYRAFQRFISARCMTVLPALVDETQKGFMPGRRIQENVWMVRAAMTSAPKGGCVTFLDFKGAYDTVPPQLLVDIMVASNFPTAIVDVIKKATMGVGGRVPYTHIQMNGATCPQKVFLHRGVRQGDPSSTWEYDLVSLLLTRLIAHKLKGLKIGGKKVITREFADDVAVYLEGSQLPKLSKILRGWEEVTTMRLGPKKCAVMPLGLEDKEWPKLQTLGGVVKLMTIEDTYTYAGVEIGMDEKLMTEKTWEKVMEKIQKRLLQYKLKGTGEQFRQQVVLAVANGAINYYATVLPLQEKFLQKINTIVMKVVLKTQRPTIKAADYLQLKRMWGGNIGQTPLQTALTRQGQLTIQALQGSKNLQDLKLLIMKDIQQMQFGRTAAPQWFWCSESHKLGASMIRSANMLAPQTSHYVSAKTPLWASLVTKKENLAVQSLVKGVTMTTSQEHVLGFNMDLLGAMWGVSWK